MVESQHRIKEAEKGVLKVVEKSLMDEELAKMKNIEYEISIKEGKEDQKEIETLEKLLTGQTQE